MPRPRNITPSLVSSAATKANMLMTRERATGAMSQLLDLRREIRIGRELMTAAYKEGDTEAASAAQRIIQTARDHWLRLVAYPLPAKLLRGERPNEASAATRGYSEAAHLQDAEEIPIPE